MKIYFPRDKISSIPFIIVSWMVHNSSPISAFSLSRRSLRNSLLYFTTNIEAPNFSETLKLQPVPTLRPT
jgi:hypothetical protein